MVWLGVSSPPRVCAVPVKRELGPPGSSPPGLGVFLARCYQRAEDCGLGCALLLCFLDDLLSELVCCIGILHR